MFLPENKTAPGNRFERFGIDTFLALVIESVMSKVAHGWAGEQGIEKIKLTGKRFLSGIETDLVTINQRQEIFNALLEDQALMEFIIKRPYPSIVAESRDGINLASVSTMVIEVVSYLSDLKKLLAEKPIYASLLQGVQKLLSEEVWFRQVETLAGNIKKYQTFKANLELELTFSREGDGKGYHYKYVNINSSKYELVLGDEVPIRVFNGLTGSITFEKRTRKKTQLYRVSCDEVFNTFGDSLIQKLLYVALGGEKVIRRNYALKAGDTSHMQIVFSGDFLQKGGGDLHANVTVDGKSASYVWGTVHDADYKGSVTSAWLPADQWSSATSKSTPDGYYRECIEGIRDDSVLIGSGRFAYKHRSGIAKVMQKLHDLLFIGALADFYISNRGSWVFPTLLPKESLETTIKKGVNPLFLKNKGGCVANSVSFDKGTKGFLVTGANSGGKTGYANMVALNQILAQLGLPVFAASATMAVKENILCHYIESDDIGVNRSRYESELHRLHLIMEQVTKYSLVIFDEPFTGTSAESGLYQAFEVLKVIARVGCSFIVNTHFHQLADKVGASKITTVKNYHFALPKPGKSTNYKLRNGAVKISHGEALAYIQKVDSRSLIAMLRKRKVVK